jgi:hypothetical protein
MTPHCQCALPWNGSWHAMRSPARLPSAADFAVLEMGPSPAWVLGNLLADIGRSCNPSSYRCTPPVQRACRLTDVYQSEIEQHTSVRSTTSCQALCLVSLPQTCSRRQPPCSPACLCRPLTGSVILTLDSARQQGRVGERRYMRAMTTQFTTARPPARRSHPPRQVVLECVARRDAAQRLSLALSLLVRATSISRVSAPGAREDTPNEPALRWPSLSREEQQRS